MRETGSEFMPDDLARHGVIPRRLGIAILATMVALPFAPPSLLAAWVGLYLLTGAAEYLLIARARASAQSGWGVAITLATATLTAFMSGLLISKGDGGARLFAVAAIS